MKKERLIERAKQWEQSSQEAPLIGYPRNDQPELMKKDVLAEVSMKDQGDSEVSSS